MSELLAGTADADPIRDAFRAGFSAGCASRDEPLCLCNPHPKGTVENYAFEEGYCLGANRIRQVGIIS